MIELKLKNSEKTTQIGAQMNPSLELLMIYFLKENIDVFAWKAVDVQGINAEVTVHRLNVDPNTKP